MIAGNGRAEITISESPSIMKLVRCKDETKEAARRAPWASP
jgi:hypothetical protein